MANANEKINITQIRKELQYLIMEAFGEGGPGSILPVDVPILDLGVSSLALVEGMRRVYDRFGVLVSIRRIIEGQVTLGNLALYIEQELNSKQTQKIKITPAHGEWKVDREIPLSVSQQHSAFLSRYSSAAAAAFNESLLLRMEGVLDGPALQAAVEEAGNRYQALRTALHPDANILQIGSGEPLEVQVEVVPAGQLHQRLGSIMTTPFETGKRLFRAILLRLSENEHILALIGHAVVIDRQALGIVLSEIARLYTVFSNDQPAISISPCLQWADYLALGETTEARQSQQMAGTYWQDVFKDGIPPLELPANHSRPPVKKYIGARLSKSMEDHLQKRLREWSREHGTTPQSVLLTAYNIFLHRLSGSSEVLVGVESEPLYLDTGLPAVANTHTMLPVLSTFDPKRSFQDCVGLLDEQVARANSHRLLSLPELIQILSLQRDQSRSAIFTAAFRRVTLPDPPGFGGLQTGFILPPSSGARYDIELIVIDKTDSLDLVFDYSTELFEHDTISRWLDGLVALLTSGLDDPKKHSGLLAMMPAPELDLLLYQWNKTERPFEQEHTVFDLITRQAQARPNQTAVRFGASLLTYAQLMRRTDEIAAQLNIKGVKKGGRVGILLKRSLDLIPALLATWRLGAIYVPIDSGFPRHRIAFMLADATAQAVITNRELLPLLDAEIRGSSLLCIEDVPGANEMLPVGIQPAHGEDSAIILFTSGSTGKPKGVEIRHRSLANILLACQEYLEFSSKSHMLALTTISFDISTNELFMPLLSGGMVEVAEDGLVADGIQLAERISTRKPSHIQATPSTWKTVLAAGWQGNDWLCIASAGEALNRELAEQLIQKSSRVWNLYGPTETTVYSVAKRMESAPGKPVQIGWPIPNTRLYVLDQRMQPTPIGVPGELYIGGVGVAPGYWQRPELTAERFLPDPFFEDGRIYRTGDLAYFMPDGQVIYLGRADDQVKIHGVRVELGEIEAALRAQDGVRDAVVTSWRDQHGDLQLVAHIIAEQPGALQTSDLRAQLRVKLPEVMLPPHFLFTEAFPQTTNGKIHRAALPAPTTASHAAGTNNFTPLDTQTEHKLAKAWASVLEINEDILGRDSDFIDLGGHSLLMTRMMLEVRKIFNVIFNMREFFGAPTIRKFAALIDERLQQQNNLIQASQLAQTDRSTEWARQRMIFLAREAQLPQYLAPARGLDFKPAEQIKTVFLTGATGFLGAYIVTEILKTTQANLYCLVRPKRGENSKLRIEKQMRNYDIWPGDESWQSTWDTRMQVVDGDVTLPRLGMSDPLYEMLARQVDAIFHGAAHVNFIYPYEALRATNVLGIHEIIQFAFHARIKPVHHLSTAAIWPMGRQYTFYEKDPIEHYGLLNLGYDEAKWVGERCLLHAADRGLPVARYRPGEVGGDSLSGHCVTDHFLIACIKGFLQFGAFPELDIEVDVAPVDYVARSMVYMAFYRKPLGRAFHLTNPNRRHMKDALAFLRNRGYQFDELPFENLRNKLVNSPDFASNALFAYQAALEDMNQVSMQLPTYDTRETRRELEGSGIICAPADEKLFDTYLSYLRGIGFIPEPENLTAGVGGNA